MKRYIELIDLMQMNIHVQNIECIPQHWHLGHSCYDYTEKPRPNSGFMFIYSPIDVTFHMKDSSITAKNGDIVYIPRDLYYRVFIENTIPPESPNSYVVNFNLYDEQNNELFLDDSIRIITNIIPRTFYKEIELLSYVAHDVIKNQLKINSAFLTLLNSVIEASDLRTKAFYPIRHGCLLLQKEWNLNEHISKYAAVCNISETHFNALFKSWSGMTPTKYRNKLRVAHSQILLKNSNLTVNEIAEITGFNDAFYFSRVFHKMTGVTPTDYRKL